MTDETGLQGKENWWKSRSIVGSLLTLISIALMRFGIDLDSADLQKILDIMLEVGQIITVLFAIWGRIDAKRMIARKLIP